MTRNRNIFGYDDYRNRANHSYHDRHSHDLNEYRTVTASHVLPSRLLRALQALSRPSRNVGVR